MNLLLTDVLACPRCGPPFGLILLADTVVERRVLEGVLGCPSCHGRFPVRGGLADLRAEPGPTPPAPQGAPPTDAQERALRLAALMGLESGGSAGRVIALLVGPAAAVAPALAALSQEAEVVAADPGVVGRADSPRVSRALLAARLPFHDRSLRGVTLSGEASAELVQEGLRVLHPLGRMVVEDAGAEARASVERAGGRVLAAEGSVLVAGARP